MPQLTNSNHPEPPTNRFPWSSLIGKRPVKVQPKQTKASHRLKITPSDNSLAVTIPNIGQPITGPTDPRWVVAIRTAEGIDSGVLAPNKREKILRIGSMLGLRPFDTNMIIAIVQDQARRGYAPEYCPTAGEPQLRMIPLPNNRPTKFQRSMATAAAVIALITLELVTIAWFFS